LSGGPWNVPRVLIGRRRRRRKRVAAAKRIYYLGWLSQRVSAVSHLALSLSLPPSLSLFSRGLVPLLGAAGEQLSSLISVAAILLMMLGFHTMMNYHVKKYIFVSSGVKSTYDFWQSTLKRRYTLHVNSIVGKGKKEGRLSGLVLLVSGIFKKPLLIQREGEKDGEEEARC